jgi:RNA polymerase sigma-70 factor (ECF subfamily)
MSPGKDRKVLYEFLVRTCADSLYRYAYRLCGSHHSAQDLVSEAFSEAWKSIDSLRDEEKARSWLYSNLRYRYAHLQRDRKRNREQAQAPQDLDEMPGSGSEYDELQRVADQDSVQKALQRLDDRFKEPFLMVFLEGLTCAEAAQQLGIPLGTVLSRIHRARATMQDYLEGNI